MKKIVSIGLLFSLVLLLSACSSSNGSETASTSEKNKQSFDNYGREISIATEPEKVLTLGPNCTELFAALGLEDRVIGSTLNNHSRGPLPEFKTAVNKIPELAYGTASREVVLSSGADFIYGIDWEFGEEGLDVTELTDYGITVYQNSAKTIAEEYQEIADLGEIFKVEKKAQKYIAQQKKRIAAVEKNNQETAVPVLVYDSGDSGVFTASGSNFESRLIEAAGGENIFNEVTDSDWITVSSEEVLAKAPEVIIVHDYDSPSAEAKIAEIKADPVLSQLPAVKNNKFVTITLESVLPGPRMAFAVEMLAKEIQG